MTVNEPASLLHAIVQATLVMLATEWRVALSARYEEVWQQRSI